MKKYSENAFESTANNIFRQINKKPNTWEIYTNFSNDINYAKNYVNEKDKGYFINAFNLVNRTTHQQFLEMPSRFRRYYAEFFKNKIKEQYNKIMKNVTNEKFKSFSDKLLNCYIKTYITFDYINQMRKYNINLYKNNL